MQTIRVETLKNLLNEDSAADTLIVDVRTRGEYRAEHILGVSNIPLDELNQHADQLQKYRHIYVHCASGNRSRQACQKLNELGLDNIVNVEGGMNAWKEAGFPYTSDKPGVIPIMRQVQLVTGALVLLGILLALLVHPNFVYLSAFVGVGLIYAGASGNCLMGELLGRMAWNR